MKSQDLNEYRGMSIAELSEQVDEHREQIYKLREKMAVEEASNPFQVRMKRREVAQLKTLIRQKEIAQNPRLVKKRKKR